MPDVKGMKKKRAVATLKKVLGSDVKLKFSYEFDKKVKKGSVIKQSISSGTSYKGGEKIVLKISKGTKPEREKTQNSQSSGKKKSDVVNYAGELPW